MATKLNLKENLNDLKDILFNILEKNTDIQNGSFEVSFEGEGDSGDIEDIGLDQNILDFVIEGCKKISNGTIWDSVTKKNVDSYEENPTVSSVVKEICYSVLQEACAGWEINSGSYGNFIFNVKNREVTLEINERITDVNTTDYTF